MARCSFCDETISQGTGIMFIKTEGKILHFCSRKCEKHMLVLGRRAIRVKWTRTSRKSKKQNTKVKSA